MQQSNVPSDLKKGQDLPNNQPKSVCNARGKIRRKRKRKDNFSSEKLVHIDDEPAKSCTKTAIKHTFSLGKKEQQECKIEDMIYPFNINEKRKKERQEEGECRRRNHQVPHVHLLVYHGGIFCKDAS